MFRGPAEFHGCQTCLVNSLRCPCTCRQSLFYCPYCRCPYFHTHDLPATSGRFYGNVNNGNSSPDQYTLRRSSSDISLHIDLDNYAYEGSNELAESVGNGGNGLPEWRFSKLPTRKYGKKPKSRWWWQKKKKFVADDSQCSICLVDYEKGDKITTLPCNHIYHRDCISRWLKENSVCCVCKRPVF